MKIVNAFTLYYPSQTVDHPKNMLLTAVLTVGDVEDYAAYVGYGNPEWIASRGAKLSWERACNFFPNIPAAQYRN